MTNDTGEDVDIEQDDRSPADEGGRGPALVASKSLWKRLYYGETAIDFYRVRWHALLTSAVLVLITAVSLFAQGMNLSLEFVGGVSWEVPAEELTVDEARAVLDEAGLDGTGARVQELSAQGVDRLKIQVEEQPETSWTVANTDLSIDDARTALDEAGLDGGAASVRRDGDGIIATVGEAFGQADRAAVRQELASAAGVENADVQLDAEQSFDEVQSALAEVAGVNPNDVSVSSVSASWGDNVTRQAVTALIVFLVLVSVFIAIRFEPTMAIAALASLFHDLLISVGVYSVLQLTVSPATVIAFLTILGYSLYDTIVVYDKIRENRARFAGTDVGYSDITNTSMNQVLMRSLNTSISSVLPVLALLIVGSLMLGTSTLREFALALFVGMALGVYSSIYTATPLLTMMHGGDAPGGRATGERLRHLVLGGTPPSHRQVVRQRRAERQAASASGVGEPGTTRSNRRSKASPDEWSGEPPDGTSAGAGDDLADAAVADQGDQPVETSVTSVLNHPPRPRKKKRH